MFLGLFGDNDDVVNTHLYQNTQVVSHNFIDDALRRRLCIAEAEGHDNPFGDPNCVLKAGFSILSLWI